MRIRFFTLLFSLLVISLFAKAEETFPKISKENTEYWYVIKSLGIKAQKEEDWGYNKGMFVNNQGNTDVVLSANINNTGLETIHSWTSSHISKWKFIQGNKSGEYAIICSNKDSKLYLQPNLTLSKNKYTKWKIDKDTGYGKGTFLIYQEEEGVKKCIDQNSLTVELSNLQSLNSPFWTFLTPPQKIKATTTNDTTWYALRNLNIDERKDKFLETQKIKNHNFLVGKKTPKQLWAFIKESDGYKLLNNKGQYLSFQTIFGDKITTVSEPEKAAILDYSQVYTNENAGYKLYVGDKEKPKFVLHLKDASNFFSVMGSWLLWDMSSCWDIVDEKDLTESVLQLFVEKYNECNNLWLKMNPIFLNSKEKLQSNLNKVAQYTKGKSSFKQLVKALELLDNSIYEYRKGFDVSQYTSIESQPKWYYIETANIKLPYLKGFVMSTHGLYQGHITLSKKSVTNSQMWRFEKLEGKNLVRIINKADGRMLKKDGILADEGDGFELLPMIDGTFNITFPNYIPLAITTGGVGNFMGGVGSLAAWRILPIESFDGGQSL